MMSFIDLKRFLHFEGGDELKHHECTRNIRIVRVGISGYSRWGYLDIPGENPDSPDLVAKRIPAFDLIYAFCILPGLIVL